MARLRDLIVAPTLVAALQRNDPAAQEQLYRMTSKAVYTLAYRILGSVEAAEDATQETFIDAFRKVKTLQKPESFVPWLLRIAANHCNQMLRSPWYKRRVETQTSTSDQVECSGVTEDTIVVEKVLAAFPPEVRIVLWLYCVEGYTHQEIARLLSKSTSYSKSVIHRAREQFDKLTPSNPMDAAFVAQNGVSK